MDELEKKIKDASNELFKPDHSRKRIDCPGQDILSRYIGGPINEKERETVEEHLMDCDFCFDFVLMQKEVTDDLPDVPAAWKASAKKLCSVRAANVGKRFIDVILKFTEETIETIRNPGMISIAYGAAPQPVRGDNNVKTSLVRLSRSFLNIKSVVEIEKAGTGLVNIRVTAREASSNAPAEGLRISLSNPQRKIASYFAKKGEAFFEGLEYGEYIINIIQLRDDLGHISFNITE